MGYIDNTGDYVEAHLTKEGFRRFMEGGPDAVRIVKFALGDDEVDYSLYDESLSDPQARGRVIKTMPIPEPQIDERYALRYPLVNVKGYFDAMPTMLITPTKIGVTASNQRFTIVPSLERYVGPDTPVYKAILSDGTLGKLTTLGDTAGFPIINKPPSRGTYAVYGKKFEFESTKIGEGSITVINLNTGFRRTVQITDGTQQVYQTPSRVEISSE